MDKTIIEKTQELENLKEIIETYTEKQQEDILNILREDKNTIINENKNGFFINLSDVSSITISKINKYIEYINLQEKHLVTLEQKTKEYEDCLNG
jgi:hypothetical protein